MKRFPFEDAQPPAPQEPAAPIIDQSPETIAFSDAALPLEPLPPASARQLDPLPAIQRILTHPQPLTPLPAQQARHADLMPNIVKEPLKPQDAIPAIPNRDHQPEAKFEPFAPMPGVERLPLPRVARPTDVSPPIDLMPVRKSDPTPPSPFQTLPARKGDAPADPKVLLSDAQQIPALPGIGQAVPVQRAPDPTQVPQQVQRRLDGLADLAIDRPPAPQSVARVPPLNTSAVEPLAPLQANVADLPDMQRLATDIKPYRDATDVDALLREVTPRRERRFLSFGSLLPLLSEEGV